MENQNLVVLKNIITVYSDVLFSDLTNDEKHPVEFIKTRFLITPE